MKYNYKSSFDRSYKKLALADQYAIDDTIENLKIFYSSGVKTKGLGIRRLKWDFWEIRASIRIRVLFIFQQDTISFIVVGNHDEIRKYLKSL